MSSGVRFRAPAWVTAGTLTSAMLGWGLLIGAARILGPDGYAELAVIWALFFALAGLLTGVQQETARAVSQLDLLDSQSFRVLPAALTVVGSVSVLTLGTGHWWARDLFGPAWVPVLAMAAAGIVGHTAQSTVVGALAARGRWRSLVAVNVSASSIRLLAVLVICLVAPTPVWLMTGIVAGALTLGVLWPLGSVRLAVVARGAGGSRHFVMGAGSAMVGGLAAALISAGLPYLVTVASPSPLGPSAGILFAALMMVRTPILMPINGLQLMMVTHFVRHRGRLWRAVAEVLAWVSLAGLASIGIALTAGPGLLSLILGSQFRLGAAPLAWLAVSAVLLAALTATGTALVATNRYMASTMGWLVALAATIMLLTRDSTLVDRVLIAATVGPALGLLVHAIGLGWRRGNP